MSQINTIIPTIRKEWKENTMGTSRIYKFIGDASRAAVLAWIVYQSGAFGTLGYVSVGTALLAIWTGILTLGGWTLESELYGKTLDFMLISRTKMSLILFSKNIAQGLTEIPTGFISFLTAVLVARAWPDFANIPALAVSLLLAFLGMIVLGFFFSTLVVLVAGRAGFFMGIMPFIAVISGFILPVNNLPLWLEIPARFTPSSWAMDGVWASITGIESWPMVIRDWGLSLVILMVWFVFTYYLCQVVEKRIRITGTLGAM
jgi:ABC-2 type transport system permease protein